MMEKAGPLGSAYLRCSPLCRAAFHVAAVATQLDEMWVSPWP
jgi:hypothetical protein